MDGKRHGMVLAETLLALLVTVLVLGILQQTLKVIKNVPDNLNAEQVRWHMTNEYIQENFQGEKIKEYTPNKLNFENKNGSKSAHVLEFYHDMLRTRTEQGGHIPLVMNLKKCTFKIKKDLIIIKMIDKKNRISEMYLTNDHQNFN
ncbi:competence type IV pilus minor pilin ComGF [Companilactobacillus keshanensis]|uniref:Competence type IV pilus minor pilin ComGF n=1 Tax=Companilactobacillus keshanensis TaxID=2486003 RepID=A0ABW4BRQ1_9LACO|nr:competence type IV pilus minor pilin ComGF [Companilactobacillus keshanensis]